MSSLRSSHDHEITAKASWKLPHPIDDEIFRRCSPQESIPFPEEIPENRRSDIFIPREMRDLRKCRKDNCAFNFLPEEQEVLGQMESDQAVQDYYFQLYKKRVDEQPEISPRMKKFFITELNDYFQLCRSPQLEKLLSSRPVDSVPYRFSNVRYDGQMRPTTRLTQGQHFEVNGTHCFAEVLIFSDHYDVELIKVWEYDPNASELQVEVRHRIDFLSTWFRRLQKPKLQTALERVVEDEIRAFQECSLSSER